MFFPKTINRALVTWFGCGTVPFAPGTMGSIGALPICWALTTYADLPFRIVVAFGVTAIGILAAAQDQKTTDTKDPQYVVIDEVAGMLWSTLLAAPTWQQLLIAFILFRIFDIFKPFPGYIFDRRSKTSTNIIHRGAYIVLDDVVAGIYALLFLLGIVSYFHI